VKDRLLSFISRISVRILAFNFLVVFLPLAGMLSLGTYERQLLQSLEHALVQQGRVMASALADSKARLEEDAQRIIVFLRQRQEARIRVLDASGRLLADSSRLPSEPAESGTGGEWGPASREPADGASGAAAPAREANETFFYRLATFLYRAASLPIQAYRRFFREPEPPYESADFYSGADTLNGPEITDALAGRYGAATRISAKGQRSVTLYSAIPVIGAGGAVGGVVLVSQSTYRILSDLYVLRLDIFMLFLYSVATAFILSLLVSATITVPMRRLRAHAGMILDRRGRLAYPLPSLKRRDEIGDLSRGFNELTHRLERQIRMAESFASDVSHEFKNPLASIRSASELLSTAEDPRQREELIRMIMDDVSRMERLLSAVQEISRLDAGVCEDGGTADPLVIARGLVEGMQKRGVADGVRFSVSGDEAAVAVPAERMSQLLENLIDNAASFSPSGGAVEIRVLRQDSSALITVRDQGMGIPEENRLRIFERFFSVRPKGDGLRRHAGLGLAIVKSIAEGCGGSITASNGASGGALFEARLPLAQSGRASG
jgi:two-component system sensor histidine kinase ChvG